MAAIRKNLSRIVAIVVVAAVVAGGVYYFTRPGTKMAVTARFTAAVGIYPGTPVRQLGVDVGTVTSVTPKVSYVEVGMSYDSKYALPARAHATEIANSLVSDRSIELSAYSGTGPTLSDGATIPIKRTSSPAEIDDIYKSLNTLSKALGPQGANKTGALSTLLKVGAANLKGNGTKLGQSIENLSQAARTLADGRGNLFGTVRHLRSFTQALSDSDGQVRLFNKQLAEVSTELANERSDLGGALKQLGIALDTVNRFVRQNRGKLHTDIGGLKRITNVLIKQKASIDETLAIAPVALANIVHSYQPNLGVIATRSNLASLTDPGQVCLILKATTDKLSSLLPGGLGNALGPLTGQIVSTCTKLIKNSPDLSGLLAGSALQQVAGQLAGELQQTLTGGLGGLVGSNPVGGLVGGNS